MSEPVQASNQAVAAAARKIVEAAESQLGVPYVWGGEDPGVGFDCSGLSQWCVAQAGISIPRGSADQFNASTVKVMGTVQAGDLVFFYGGETSGPRPGHVGIVTGPGQMIDAPFSGVDVRFDSYSASVSIGPLDYYGATRPALLAGTVTPPPPEANLCDVQLRVLSEGMVGYDVKAVQILLNALNNAGLVTDSDFGLLTKTEVMRYQQKFGYQVDGIVGAVTWRSLLGAPNPS